MLMLSLIFKPVMMARKQKTAMKDENIPDKLVYKLEEISRITRLDPKVINSWEREFTFLNAGETGTGSKIFRKKDLTIILRLKELMEDKGLTLAGAKRQIEEFIELFIDFLSQYTASFSNFWL